MGQGLTCLLLLVEDATKKNLSPFIAIQKCAVYSVYFLFVCFSSNIFIPNIEFNLNIRVASDSFLRAFKIVHFIVHSSIF